MTDLERTLRIEKKNQKRKERMHGPENYGRHLFERRTSLAFHTVENLREDTRLNDKRTFGPVSQGVLYLQKDKSLFPFFKLHDQDRLSNRTSIEL